MILERFTQKEKKEQVLAAACNHKKVTVRGIQNITGFSEDFITNTLDHYTEKGVLKTSKSYVLDGDKVNEKCWRVKKKYLQIGLFGSLEEDEED